MMDARLGLANSHGMASLSCPSTVQVIFRLIIPELCTISDSKRDSLHVRLSGIGFGRIEYS